MTLDLAKFLAALPGGFLTDKEMTRLIALDRLHPVLVRCGGGRFTCPAQDFAHLEACIVAGGDYIRDVSICSEDYRKACAEWSANLAKAKPAACRPWAVSRSISRGVGPDYPAFDERDCSGVYDGIQVTSDADSGL